MAFGVFILRPDSIYDDSPAERYQFPGVYLKRAMACAGDWIIYYEPKKVSDTRGYFAAARISEIIADPNHPAMHVAIIEVGSYLPFVNAVPFSGPDGVMERGVLNEGGRISGRAQAAVRTIAPADFRRIVDLGLADHAWSLPRIDAPSQPPGLAEEQMGFEPDSDRNRYLGSRMMRDRVFRHVVLQAYGSRCAVTGLKLINGGGRAEVEAAHIRSVIAGGPDIVSNGLALSGTAHWMFDRGLIGVADDLRILISRQVNDPDDVRKMINPSGSILPTGRQADRPHPHFLRWHREHCFKD